MESMMKYHASFFEVVSLDIERNTLKVIDILDKNREEFEIMDLGLSHSLQVGSLFFSRLLPTRNVFITSGMLIGYPLSENIRLLSDLSFAKFKKRGKRGAIDLFVFPFMKGNQYGTDIVVQDVI